MVFIYLVVGNKNPPEEDTTRRWMFVLFQFNASQNNSQPVKSNHCPFHVIFKNLSRTPQDATAYPKGYAYPHLRINAQQDQYSQSRKYSEHFTFPAFSYVTAQLKKGINSFFSSEFYTKYPMMTA